MSQGKKVQVTVTSAQTNDLEEKDSMEFQTSGSLYIKNQCIYLIYDESII